MRIIKRCLRFLLAITVLFAISQTAMAALNLELTQGVNSELPIAIVPFQGEQANSSSAISQIVTADLQNSGQFKPMSVQSMPQQPNTLQNVNFASWNSSGVDSLVIGNIQQQGSQYRIEFYLLNVAGQSGSASSNAVLLHQAMTVNASQFRQAAHKIADLIYQKLTGVPGAFSTKIAYVLVQRPQGAPAKYQLVIADYDGNNPQAILTSDSPLMSPAWSPDGKRIAYVSFENMKASIYVADLRSGGRRLITQFPGINGAPAWSPDGSSLALVLSKSGNPNIYIANLASGSLQRVTNDWSIDTEPSWSPDGKSLIFTSDREGTPQIYQVSLATGTVNSLTYSGNYNARASFSYDGSVIVMQHRDSSAFNVAVQNMASNNLQVLTNINMAKAPSFSPNAAMIVYCDFDSGIGVLNLVSSNGNSQISLPTADGSMQDPAWSPYIQ